MKSWKQVLIFGSLGATVFLFLTGRKQLAGVLAGAGLAALAAEYPEQMQHLWDHAPEYVNKGNRILNMAAAFLERLAEHRVLREGSPYVV